MTAIKFTTVAALLADPARWTQGALARNALHCPVGPYAEDACCWCLSGAIQYIYQDPEKGLRAYHALEDILRKRGYNGVPSFNDSTVHGVVLAVCEEAGI